MQLSTLGLGTYLGEADAATDRAYEASARAFRAAGGNVFDTAANYRMGRSERALGTVLRDLPRESFFVSTKAGYLPFGDGATEESPRAWFERTLLRPGVLKPEDVADGVHAMTPGYLSHQLDVSRAALGVEAVDLFHLHNPEHQLPALGPEAFHARIRAAFEACEGFVREGRIRAYGVATWNGFRVGPERPEHLSLERLLRDAEAAGGKEHHFRWVQLPLNLALPEAFLVPTQAFGGERVTLLEAARRAGIRVQTSASIMQARILGQLAGHMDHLREALPGCGTPAQAALQFTRSCPGVEVALVGMSSPAHVAENAAVMGLPRAPESALQSLFG